MRFIEHSHRFAKAIIESDEILKKRYYEFIESIKSITDDDIIRDFNFRKQDLENIGKDRKKLKSVTPSINHLLREKMLGIPGWEAEVDIFNDTSNELGNTEWRLDFACDKGFAVEVAFNHGEAIAWNLIKPVLTCELNHVQKAIQTQIGIYVCATDAMKIVGNIDSASGSFEKVLRYLPPMMNQLTVPIMIIGLEPFESFRVNKTTREIERI